MMKNLLITALGLAVACLGFLLRAQDSKPTDAPPEAPPPLGATLAAIPDNPGLRHTLIGFCLLDDQGAVAAAYQADLALIPASALKTLTTATAFELLGPEFTFATELRGTAAIGEDGTLDGDLVLRGGGDPTLSMQDLQTWVELLKSKGLTALTGRVIGDASAFPETIAGDFWDWGDVGNGYGSPTAGLNLEHNRYTAHLEPGEREGEPAAFVKAVPEVPGIEWINRVLTGPPDSGDLVRIYSGPFATRIQLHGSAPLGATAFTTLGSVPDPALFAAHHLDRLLEAAGISRGAKPTGNYQATVEANILLDTHNSAPLIEIIAHLHETSDNHDAECLYQLLGTRANRAPPDVIRDAWKERGLELPSLRLVDGSGLGRANTISARDLAALQFHARRTPSGDAYHDSLPLVLGGTGRIKPGGMSGIRTYAGFITGQTTQREFAFALLINHALDGAAVNQLTSDLLRAVANL